MSGLQIQTNKRTNDAARAERRANPRMPVILIVENDDDNRQMLKFLLELWKYFVYEAKNGFEALEIVERHRPDLILMDAKLPFLDGFDTTRQIRESPETKNVPVVFVSGCADSASRRAAYAAGGNEYLVKPINFQELEAALGKFIQRL